MEQPSWVSDISSQRECVQEQTGCTLEGSPMDVWLGSSFRSFSQYPALNRKHQEVAEDLVTGASRARDQNSHRNHRKLTLEIRIYFKYLTRMYNTHHEIHLSSILDRLVKQWRTDKNHYSRCACILASVGTILLLLVYRDPDGIKIHSVGTNRRNGER